MLKAIHRRVESERAVHVDPDSTGLNRACDPMCAPEVERPDAGREPELRVVGEGERLFLVFKRYDGQHGTKHFLGQDRVVASKVAQDGRLKEIAARMLGKLHAPASVQHGGAVRHRLVRQALILFQLRQRRHRSHLRIDGERIADADFRRACNETRQKFVVDTTMQTTAASPPRKSDRYWRRCQPGFRLAPASDPRRERQSVGSCLQAPTYADETPGGPFRDRATPFHAARKGDLDDLRVIDEIFTRLAQAGHHVDDTRWNSN